MQMDQKRSAQIRPDDKVVGQHYLRDLEHEMTARRQHDRGVHPLSLPPRPLRMHTIHQVAVWCH